MDITNNLYTKTNIIKEFEKKYGDIRDIGHFNRLMFIYNYYVVKNGVHTEKELAKIERCYPNNYPELVERLNYDKNELLEDAKRTNDYELYSRYIEAEEQLSTVVNICKEYAEITLAKVKEEGFTVTFAQIAKILDTTENYSSRFLKDFFTYFTVSRYARYWLKYTNAELDLKFLNKKVVISKESFHGFLKKHLKQSQPMEKVDFEFSSEQIISLLAKFKTEDIVRSSLKIAIQQEEMLDGKNVRREDQPLFPLTDSTFDIILNESWELCSIATLRKRGNDSLKRRTSFAKNARSYSSDITKNYTYESYNTYQVYVNLLNKVSCTRLVLDGVNVIKTKEVPVERVIETLDGPVTLKVMEKQESIEKKTMIRYLLHSLDANFVDIDEKDAWVYNINYNTYRRIVEKQGKDISSGDKTPNELIVTYFYNKLISTDFSTNRRYTGIIK